MQQCSPAEMRAPFKLNLFVCFFLMFKGVHLNGSIFHVCFFNFISHVNRSSLSLWSPIPFQEKFVPRCNIQTFIYII